MIKTRLTKKKIKDHLAYAWWKYALLVLFAVFGWNLIYTTTAYRPPEDKVVDLYVVFAAADTEKLQTYLDETRTAILPDMEQSNAVTLMGESDSDPYASMQISVYIAAAQGDIYMMPKDTFKTYAADGAFTDLTPYLESGVIQTGDMDLSSGKVALKNEDGTNGEKYQAGIPASSLLGFYDFTVDPKDMYLCMLISNGNDDNCAVMLNQIIADMTPKE